MKESVADKLKAGAYTNKVPYCGIRVDAARHQAYREEENRLTVQFRLDLEEENGTGGLSKGKRDALWAKAWADGHASGLSEVAIHYSDLAELMLTV